MTLGPKLDLLRHGPSLNEVFSWPMLLVIVFISIFFNWVHNACVVFLGTQILITLVPLIMNTWNRHLFIESISFQHLDHLYQVLLLFIRIYSILRFDKHIRTHFTSERVLYSSRASNHSSRWLLEHIAPVIDLIEESAKSPLSFLRPLLKHRLLQLWLVLVEALCGSSCCRHASVVFIGWLLLSGALLDVAPGTPLVSHYRSDACLHIYFIYVSS
jgi:hypothetical protein